MPVRGGARTLRLGSTTPPFISFHLTSFCITGSIKPSLWKPAARVTGFSHMSGSLLSPRRLEEDAFTEQHGVQRKGCCLKASRKKTGLTCEGPGGQDDPTEVPAPTAAHPTWPAPTWHTHRSAEAPGRAPGRANAVTLLISQAGPPPTHCFYTLKIKKAELGILGRRIKQASDTEKCWEGPGKSCQGHTML